MTSQFFSNFMNPADDKNNGKNNTNGQNQSFFPISGVPSKEQEVISGGVRSEHLAEVSPKLEIPKEVEKVGVTKIGETIELPPDVTKLGITHTGPTAPVIPVSYQSVKLPISDKEVLVGQNASITDGLRWLAVWCVKQLKKANLVLKVVKGQVVRVKKNQG
jgi:hypothetical protein